MFFSYAVIFFFFFPLVQQKERINEIMWKYYKTNSDKINQVYL